MQITFDERRDLVIAGNLEQTLTYSLKNFVQSASVAIAHHGFFTVALSGGSTPKKLFEMLSKSPWKDQIEWPLVRLFWSDERAVSPDHLESNYHMAMEAGFKELPIAKNHIFRMQAEESIEEHAKDYEKLLKEYTHQGSLDLVMLGMGEDGHTASLFPKTHGLNAEGLLVVANYIPQKRTWRMTLTFEAIEKAQHKVIYVTGKNKAQCVDLVLHSSYNPILYPIQKIGSSFKKALWILDLEAASQLS